MSKHTARARDDRNRTGLYEEITDKIIAELEAGRIPWVQPWGTAAAKAPLAMPQNAVTRRRYSGINVLILWGAVIERGFSGQSWLTFRQAVSLGGNVRKGERGTAVVYADRFVPDDERRRAAETGQEAQAIPFLKRFTVFSTDQCEGLPDNVASIAPPPPPDLIEPQAEALIAASAEREPFTTPSATSCRFRLHRPISSRSTGIARLFTNSVIGVERPPDLVGISADLLARSPTRARNWWRK